jgi:hypothetical protein
VVINVDEQDRKLIRMLGVLSTVGLVMVFATVIGLFIGLKLDEWLGTSPWLTAVFLCWGSSQASRIYSSMSSAVRKHSMKIKIKTVIDEDRYDSSVTGIIRGVTKKTALIVLVAAVAALAFNLIPQPGQRWWFLPASILFGGVLGLLNFRWLAVAVQRVYLRKGATPGFSNLAAMIISMLKLSVIFIILFVVIKWQLAHIFGLVGGLSLSFLAILWEGVTVMKHTLRSGGQ